MSTQAQVLAGKRVLIVEDNVLVAKFFRMALERAGGCSCLISDRSVRPSQRPCRCQAASLRRLPHYMLA